MNRIVLFGVIGLSALAAFTNLLQIRSPAAAGIQSSNAGMVAQGEVVYVEHCAVCHGKQLEGQPNWRTPLPEGGLPAPPHDASGHTWHHSDQLLFDYTKLGGQALLGPQVKSNMPGFGERLSDQDIWAVLSFIKSTWPSRIQKRHDKLNERQTRK